MAAACASARAPRTSAADPEAGGKALVVLLADPGTDTVGRAVVSNAHGAVDLDMARESTRVSSNAAPSPPEILSEGEVRGAVRPGPRGHAAGA